MAEIDEAFEFSEISRREQNFVAGGDLSSGFLHERWNAAVKARGGLRLNGAGLDSLSLDQEMIEVQPGVAGNLPIPIVGEEIGCDCFFRRIAVLKRSLRVREEFLGSFVNRFRLVKEDYGFIEQIEKRMRSRSDLFSGYVGAVCRSLQQRRHGDSLDRAHGALRIRIEFTQGFDGVSK